MADVFTKDQRRKNMQAIRSKETVIEQKVSKSLWNQGIRFRKNVDSLYGKPDFAIKKYKIAIFIDSCFWHGCEEHGRIPKSNKEYWIKKINRNKERDREVTSYYTSNGWNVMRVWEHEFKNDFDKTIEKITNFIRKTKKLCT